MVTHTNDHHSVEAAADMVVDRLSLLMEDHRSVDPDSVVDTLAEVMKR